MECTRFVSFSGTTIETTVTQKASTVTSWISNTSSSLRNQEIIVGLDCEWRPNTSPLMNNRTATLQLCVGNKCLILQLLYVDYLPEILKNFLKDPNVVLVGVEVERDVSKIRQEYGLECKRVVDVREVAMSRWPDMFYRKPGLKDVAHKVVGLVMPKPMSVCRSDWQARALDGSQIEYAAIDAYASYRIGQRLLNGL